MSSENIRQRKPQGTGKLREERNTQDEKQKHSSQRWRCPFLTALILSLFASILVFILLPSPLKAVEYTLPEPPDLTGVLEPNNVLQHSEKLFEGQLAGPESIVKDGDYIYTGTTDGWIKVIHKGEIRDLVRFGKEPCGGPENEPTCGRVLGMRMDKNGFLIAADSYFGLFKVNVATGDYQQLFSWETPVNGKLAKFFNDLDIGPDGKIYFTSSSADWQRKDWHRIILSGLPNGRLLMYDPKTGKTIQLMDGLGFANGVQLTKDKSAVLVVELLQARIWRFDFATQKATVWADNLPGFGDNIRYHKSTGTYWLGMALVRQKGRSLLDRLGSYSWLREQIAKMMPSSQLMITLSRFFTTADTKAMAVEFNENGTIVRTIQDRTGEVIEGISEVENDNGVFYFGSFNAGYIGRLFTKKAPSF